MTTNLNQSPIPAIAAQAGPYKIVSPMPGTSGTCTMITEESKTGLFGVPLDGSKTSQGIRAHEYGHLGLDSLGLVPKGAGKAMLEATGNSQLGNLAVQSILDVIVNQHMIQNGIEDVRSLPYPHYVNRREIDITTYLRSLGVVKKQKPKVLTAAEQFKVKALYKRLTTQLASGFTIEQLVDATKILYDAMIAPEEPKAPPQSGSGDTRPSGSGGESQEPREGETLPEDAPEPAEKPKKPLKQFAIPNSIKSMLNGKTGYVAARPSTPEKDPKKHLGDNYKKTVPWASMEILTEALTQPIGNAQRNARRVKPGFVGPLRYPVRALLPAFDGSAFGLPQRSKGGTMLIDLSGSMSLTDAAITKIVSEHPHITIAGYSSNQMKNGYLAVLAKNGRMIPQDGLIKLRHKMGIGNGVDGPALEWLNQQRGPHIWICDGQVTGINDDSNWKLDEDALKLKARGRVIQYPTIDAFTNKRAIKINMLFA